MDRTLETYAPLDSETQDIRLIRSILLATLLVGLVVGESRAQNQPPVREIAPQNAVGTKSVHAADLNGDGDQDVLYATSQTIAWHENTESGFSDQGRITGSVNGARSVHASDIDGDGDIDVLSASFYDAKIAWYENTKSGFSSQKIITTSANGAESVYTADLDEDGDPDALSASSEDDKIAWYENTESGFSTQKIIRTNAIGAASVYAADMDGDDDLDVLSALSDEDEIAWYENKDIDPGFSDRKVINNNADLAVAVHAADIDEDGDPDVLSASTLDDKIVWYENTSFGFGQTVITKNAARATSVYTADLDGDSDLDVLSASEGDDKIAWYENTDGNGSFSDEQVITTSAGGAASVYAADLDGDSSPDVLSASFDGSKIGWHSNDLSQNNGFSSEKVIAPIDPVGNVRDAHAADLDGDSDPDVVFASTSNDKIAWYENTNSGFSGQRTITNSADKAEAVYTADLDEDGDSDVLSASQRDNKVAWYENTKSGFSEQRVITTDAVNAKSVYAADLDGDVDPDVLSASSFDDKIAWYENTKSGFSDQKVITTNANGAESVYAADLDGDSDLDVLSASSSDDKIAWYENTSGGFSSQKIITTSADRAVSVYAGDLDGDSDPDVLSASKLDDKIAWYENIEGGFSDQNVITDDATDAQSVRVADLDGDSELEVLSASGNKVSWYEKENVINGISFTRNFVYGHPSMSSQSVSTTDIDGDSNLDILSSFSDSDNERGEIVWNRNTSSTLPVEIASLRGTYSGQDGTSSGAVRLSWQTASETNNAGFRVQRRIMDEKGWKTVGDVEGNGTTSRPRSYRFTDTSLPYEGDPLVYRLKQVDTDGSTSFSKTVAIDRSVEAIQLRTYPNPVRQQATIHYALPEQQDIEIRLYDVLGRQVRTVVRGNQEGRHKHEIDASGLSSGIYLLRLQSKGQVHTRRLTIVQ